MVNTRLLLYILGYSDIFRQIFLHSGDLVSKSNTPPRPVLYTPNVKAIQTAIDSTAKSNSALATAGNMSKATFSKCLKEGSTVTRATANGVVLALNTHGAKPQVTIEMLFTAVPPKAE